MGQKCGNSLYILPDFYSTTITHTTIIPIPKWETFIHFRKQQAQCIIIRREMNEFQDREIVSDNFPLNIDDNMMKGTHQRSLFALYLLSVCSTLEYY